MYGVPRTKKKKSDQPRFSGEPATTLLYRAMLLYSAMFALQALV
ncbi:hypothetical protein [Magnetofaba australis]|nr:hypothetical protein [Magnetofaba australis]